MKDLKVSNETHSLLFSLKNKLIVSYNKKFTYDDVMKFLIQEYNEGIAHLDMKPLNNIYQLEEKP